MAEIKPIPQKAPLPMHCGHLVPRVLGVLVTDPEGVWRLICPDCATAIPETEVNHAEHRD